ncbi:MAG: FAD-linked oxidase C-terminal domain-containing protein [Alphaproteobacteria bacterium]
MLMPEPDPSVIARRREIARDLANLLPDGAVVADLAALKAWESDALTAYRQPPLIVVLPETTEQVSQVLRYCHGNGVKVVPRGAGTSLSGGALPLADGIVVALTKFTRILDIDTDNRTVTAQSGVTNLAITHAVQDRGFFYAPDPSSQVVCTIGGNIAENSGGIHCLKYGLTTNNVLGAQVVMMDGEVLQIGGKALDASGYDLMGVLTGSEGLLAVVTEVTVRILPKPPSVSGLLVAFPTIESAGATVAAVIGAGIIPAAMEMMDRISIGATEAFVKSGYPSDAEAVLIVELDGPPEEVAELTERVMDIARAEGATSVRASRDEAERQLFWAGRKAAFPAMARLMPDYYVMDGTIPRGRMPEVLSRIGEIGRRYQLAVANVFHAGDGNLHPLIMYDASEAGMTEQAEACGAEILRLCVEVGGVLTGEHGVGVEKRDLMPTMFSDDDLKQQQRLKCAFDPRQLLNPGKVFPTLHRCAELGRMHVHRGQVPFPDLPRF